MSKKDGPNLYKDGVLIHKSEWGNPVSDNFSPPLNHKDRRRILSKSNLKRLYRTLVGNENM